MSDKDKATSWRLVESPQPHIVESDGKGNERVVYGHRDFVEPFHHFAWQELTLIVRAANSHTPLCEALAEIRNEAIAGVGTLDEFAHQGKGRPVVTQTDVEDDFTAVILHVEAALKAAGWEG